MTQQEPQPPAHPHTRVGAYAICLDDAGRLLLSRIAAGYPAAGRWTLPGGGVEHGEHPDDAVLRELREETGLEGRREGVLGLHSQLVERPLTRPGPLHVLALLYGVAVTGGTLMPEVGGSSDACAWLDRTEIAGLPRTFLLDAAMDILDRPAARGVGAPPTTILGSAVVSDDADPDHLGLARALRRAMAAGGLKVGMVGRVVTSVPGSEPAIRRGLGWRRDSVPIALAGSGDATLGLIAGQEGVSLLVFGREGGGSIVLAVTSDRGPGQSMVT